MSKIYNVVVFGLGGIGKAHIKGVLGNVTCKLYGICDVCQETLDAVAAEHPGVVTSTDYRAFLADPNVDVVIVGTPDFVHAEQSVAALEAGKHVLCEKPLAMGMADVEKIVAAVEKSSAKFMIGQVCRYAPGFRKAKELVDEGKIGKLFFVESEYAHNYGHARGVADWRVNPLRDPMVGGGCHAVDLLRWVAGEMKSVSALSNHYCLTDWPVNDCTVSIFQFENGIIGKVMASIGCVRTYTMRSVFYGTEGTIICDNTSDHIRLASPKFQPDHGNDFVDIPVDINNHNVTAELADFMDAIINEKPVLTNVYEGARTVAAATAASESAREGGKPVMIRKF